MTEELLYAVYRRQDNQLHLLGDDLTISELKPYTLKKALEWSLDIFPVDCLSSEGPDAILVLKHEPVAIDQIESVAEDRQICPCKPAPLHDYYAEYEKTYNPNHREEIRRLSLMNRAGLMSRMTELSRRLRILHLVQISRTIGIKSQIWASIETKKDNGD